MSDKASGSEVDSELASRLDTLFDDGDVEPTRKGGEADDPLDELNSLVMSIEWEITDDLMERFVAQVETLKKRYKDDRILVMFLQLLGSLGLYVKSNRGNAHPTAFSLLSSVYASFANAAMPGKISSSEKKKLLYNELNKYKELKEQIGTSRDTPTEIPLDKEKPRSDDGREENEISGPHENNDTLLDQAPPNPTVSVTPKQLEEAVESIKGLIKTEFKRLREVLGQK